MQRKTFIGRVLALCALAAQPGIAHAAGGWTETAVPTHVEIVRNEGFMVFGAFGNTGNTPCSAADAFWVPIAHVQYKELLSSALSAVAAGLKLKAYAHICVAVGWHGGTYNQLEEAGALYIYR